MSKVTCPVCKGVCGVNVAIDMNTTGNPEYASYAEDWYDCDFCDATGEVSEEKAKEYDKIRF